MPQVDFALDTAERSAKSEAWAKAGACVANIVILQYALCQYFGSPPNCMVDGAHLSHVPQLDVKDVEVFVQVVYEGDGAVQPVHHSSNHRATLQDCMDICRLHAQQL